MEYLIKYRSADLLQYNVDLPESDMNDLYPVLKGAFNPQLIVDRYAIDNREILTNKWVHQHCYIQYEPHPVSQRTMQVEGVSFFPNWSKTKGKKKDLWLTIQQRLELATKTDFDYFRYKGKQHSSTHVLNGIYIYYFYHKLQKRFHLFKIKIDKPLSITALRRFADCIQTYGTLEIYQTTKNITLPEYLNEPIQITFDDAFLWFSAERFGSVLCDLGNLTTVKTKLEDLGLTIRSETTLQI
jgi:hypothetical protein